MTDADVRFDCKQEKCGQEVTYVPQAVSGLIYDRPAGLGGRMITVYLTCDNGHTNPYQVPG
jgi:hypothetical protein